MRLVFTGTQVYGVLSEGSDIDIVVTHDEAIKIKEALGALDIVSYQTTGQEGYGLEGGFYFDVGPLKLNIINAGDEPTKEQWAEATAVMSQQPPIKDREKRIFVFKQIFESLMFKQDDEEEDDDCPF